MRILFLLLFLLSPKQEGLLNAYYKTHSANAAYNLGVLKYREGQLADSIYWWRIASLKNIQDYQADSNIRIAKRKLGLSQELVKFNPRGKLFNPDLFSFLFLVFFMLLSLYISYCLFRSFRISPLISLSLLFLSLAFSLISFNQWRAYRNPNVCVVMENSQLYSEPREGLSVGEVHSGAEFESRRVLGEWVEIEMPWGGIAWLKRENLRIIRDI